MVAKSRAEIQKAYRERQKKKNEEEFLKKERERVKRYFVPAADLGRRDKLRRRVANSQAVKRYNQKKKAAEQAKEQLPEEIAQPLIVRLPFPNRKKGSRKRISRAYGKKYKELNQMKVQLAQMKKKYKTVMRKLQRRSKSDKENCPATPKSKTKAQMEEARLNPEQVKKIKKQILLSNVVMEEVKATKKQNKRGKGRVLHNTIAGKVVKKYRCLSALSKKTGLARGTLARCNSKNLEAQKMKRRRNIEAYRDEVISFFERDDNSRCMPGKADKVKVGKENIRQKRVLTDYLANLYQKFISEHPNVKLSLTSFKRIRPKHVMLTAFITRDSCLCTRHQNMALLLKALQRMGIDVPKNPETFVSTGCVDEVEEKLDFDEVNFQEWKRVQIDDKGQKKHAMRVVDVKKNKADFMKYFKEKFQSFSEHVTRMKKQYAEIRSIKQQLPKNHVLVHMDFAENYQCKSMEEVQSAYWNMAFVTLHPAVVYRPGEGDEDLQHENRVYISNDLNHNSAAVVTFVKDLIEKIKEENPDVACVHYWTDSPTSQYRNKSIFYLVANHESLFGLKAIWNYFEAGHGKGPCDGIGGSTKRCADQAMKSGKAIIQDPHDFYAWTQGPSCNLKNIQFTFIEKERCEETAREIERWPCKAVKGTMKLHSVVGRGQGKILVNEVSCYCNECMTGTMCAAWKEEKTNDVQREIAVEEEQENQQANPQDQEKEQEKIYEIGTFVGALYEQICYIGKVIDQDLADELPYQITFLQAKKAQFQWPRPADVIWCRKEDILFTVQEPQPSGKSKRLLKLSAEDQEKLDNV